jgi:hypothetical protein
MHAIVASRVYGRNPATPVRQSNGEKEKTREGDFHRMCWDVWPGVFGATLSCTLMIFTCQHAKSVTQKLWQQHKLWNFYFISVRAKSPARSLSASVHIPFQAA